MSLKTPFPNHSNFSRGHPKSWFRKGSPPQKNPINSGLGIIVNLPRIMNVTYKPQWNKNTSQVRHDYPSRSYGNNSRLHGMETTEVKIIRTSEKRSTGLEIGNDAFSSRCQDKKAAEMDSLVGKTTMAELGVWWNDLTPEFIGITVITEKLGEVSFVHGERIWQLFPPKNGLTMYSVLVVGFVDERISWIW